MTNSVALAVVFIVFLAVGNEDVVIISFDDARHKKFNQ